MQKITEKRLKEIIKEEIKARQEHHWVEVDVHGTWLSAWATDFLHDGSIKARVSDDAPIRKFEKNQWRERKLSESVDHAASATVVTHASKLLKALETFEEHATDPMKEALSAQLDVIRVSLENMVSTPASYVKPASTKKVVTLRKVDGDNVV